MEQIFAQYERENNNCNNDTTINAVKVMDAVKQIQTRMNAINEQRKQQIAVQQQFGDQLQQQMQQIVEQINSLNV